VYAGQNLSQVFSALNLKPDFELLEKGDGSDLEFVHRKLTSGDIYFVNNRSDHDESVDAISAWPVRRRNCGTPRRYDGASSVQIS